MGRPSLADKDFLTVIETAEFFGLSRRKLFRLLEEENLPFMAMYGTRKLIIKDELKKIFEKNSWRLVPTNPQPVGKAPCLSLREMEKMVRQEQQHFQSADAKDYASYLQSYLLQ